VQFTPMRTLVKHVLNSTEEVNDITIKGWVRTRRDNKDFSFIEINDGSCLKNIQCIIDIGVEGFEDVSRMTTGAAAGIRGKLVPSQGITRGLPVTEKGAYA